MHEEKRSLKRRHLIFYLEVFDDRTGQYLGHLVDITTKGIMLVSKDPIETGETRLLRMILPEEFAGRTHLVFEAKSVWSGKDINPDFYDTGFEVANLSLAAKRYIQGLIEQMGFND
ncbi:MAG: PilZ domain-containing protein [Thermodesulfobacteriota bacterium]